MMTQLILYPPAGGAGVTMPYTSHDKYQSYSEELGQQVEMISGRIVWEIRGRVQIVHYEYDYIPAAQFQALAAILRSGQAFRAEYLPDDGSELVSSMFICRSFEPPVFAFDRHGIAYWHNISFDLREVRPHD